MQQSALRNEFKWELALVTHYSSMILALIMDLGVVYWPRPPDYWTIHHLECPGDLGY